MVVVNCLLYINGTIRTKKMFISMKDIMFISKLCSGFNLKVFYHCVQVVFAVNVLDTKCSPVVVNCV